MENEIVSGLENAWSLIRRLGEGDAGEVYLVASLAGDRIGVLKRPQKSAFTSDILRQAAQIKGEGQILKTLSTLNKGGLKARLKVPELLDQSKEGGGFSDRLFIVVERAAGFDLGFLSRTSRMGLPGNEANPSQLTGEEKVFLESIAEMGRIPERILLSCLIVLLQTLQLIHQTPVEVGGVRLEGIIYNDIKPEHIFWDPTRAVITLIDWGNSQFVEQGGVSQDRQYGTQHDFSQFVEEMGKFLAVNSPELRSQLEWPPYFDFSDDLFLSGGLSDRIATALQKENERLVEFTNQQESLLQPGDTNEDVLLLLEKVQKELLGVGEIPDYRGAARFVGGYATQLVMKGDIAATQRVAAWAARLPCDQVIPWQLTSRLAQIAMRSQEKTRAHFMNAIQAVICSDGEAALWHLMTAIQDVAEPNWWYEVVGQIRKMQLGIEADTLLPLVAVNRLALALRAQSRLLEDSLIRQAASQPGIQVVANDKLESLRLFIRSLEEDVIETWTQVDPHPPHAFLDYDYLGRTMKRLGPSLQKEYQTIDRLLMQPRAQVRLVLDAWDRKEFVAASQGLRHVLLWDPNRRRVLKADRLILSAPEWLRKVHLGPSFGAHFQEFATDLEFEGRELRNHVGPAIWLDEILDCLARLRKGVWPSDLLVKTPELIHEMPWLRKFERQERLPLAVKALQEEATPAVADEFVEVTGMHEDAFGPGGSLWLLEPLDAWSPEARGSSARVYLGEQKGANGQNRQVAVKLMRLDKADYSIPLFHEEVQILAIMDKIPGINRMLECGFIKMENGSSLPLDSDLVAIQKLSGPCLRIGPDACLNFAHLLEERVKNGWTPYLILEKQEKENNLLMLCDAGLNHGRYLPLTSLLQMTIQICDIMQAAHDRRIVYRDHKILHYYWHEPTNGVFMIDWNVARLHSEPLTEYEKRMDLVQFGARGMHYILTGRSAPGALPLGPTRPDEIEQAAETYRTQWTYDDERLPQGLRDVLEEVLAGKYTRAVDLRDDLKGIYMHV